MDEQLQAQLLAQMKDVQLPEPVSWWPLAIGWWLLALMVIVTIVSASVYLYKRHQHNRYRALAIAELAFAFKQWQSLANDHAYIMSANNVLKRAVRTFNPSVVNQFADAWVDSLDSHTDNTLSAEARHALALQCYQAQVSADIPKLHREFSLWLKQHKQGQTHA